MLAYETFIKCLSLDNPWAGTSWCKTTRCTYYSQQQGSRMTHSKSTQDHEHTWWLHDRRYWKTEEAWGWWLWGWWGLGGDGVVGYQQLPCPEGTIGRKGGNQRNTVYRHLLSSQTLLPQNQVLMCLPLSDLSVCSPGHMSRQDYCKERLTS